MNPVLGQILLHLGALAFASLALTIEWLKGLFSGRERPEMAKSPVLIERDPVA